jgi:hypothetical protein
VYRGRTPKEKFKIMDPMMKLKTNEKFNKRAKNQN